MVRSSDKYAIELEQMSAPGAGAAEAAEGAGARTLICSDETPVAAIVPWSDVAGIEPADPGGAAVDPLLSLCGACCQDLFVDGLVTDFGKTMLFHKS